MCLHIDSYVRVKGVLSSADYIVVADYPPFNTWQIDDYIEIDLDEMVNRSPITVLKNTSIVRKVSSSAVVPSSSGGVTINATPSSSAEVAAAVTQTMINQADRTGADFQCQIEQGTGNVNLFYRPKK